MKQNCIILLYLIQIFELSEIVLFHYTANEDLLFIHVRIDK